jgi:tetratricopeptide (TPR) repeat protein
MVSLKSSLRGTMPATLNRNNLCIPFKSGSFTPISYLAKIPQTHRNYTQALSSLSPSTETTGGDHASSNRRSLLAAFCLLVATPASITQPALAAAETAALSQADIDLSLAPNQALYDAADPRLRAAAALVQDALNADDVRKEEALWTKIINEYSNIDAPWGADVVGRAWGNRGNARARQGKLQEALSDYNTAIKLCPWSVDPVLNRGVTLEALGRFPEAIADYKSVLKVAPDDPSAWNNYGNASAGLGDWKTASEGYARAAQLAPQFSFAMVNKAVADFQLGRDDIAFKQLRTLLRRYPDFADARAALAAALWDAGLQAQAEEEWGRVNDPRYRDLSWLQANRRWPPRLVSGLTAFLQIKDIK